MFKKIIFFISIIITSILYAHGNILTIDFKGMAPHVGQKLQVRVVDKYNNNEVARKTLDPIAAADFMMFFDGIEIGSDYNIDFYADLNKNGFYDNPPTDHTWRIELNDVQGDTIIPFTHNTNFTSLDWQYAVTLKLQSMAPHSGSGQKFEARLIDKKTMLEISRYSIDSLDVAEFEVNLPGVIPDESYFVDFYADLNKNGLYDEPPVDHAWRLEAEKPQGDTTLTFTHNTSFTDINWKYLLSLQFSGMTPHIGQMLEMRVTDRLTQMEVGRSKLAAIPQANFELGVPGINASGLYRIDFYADLNKNGLYNDAPTDHTWRLDTESTVGNTSASFSHNTNFTALGWNYLLFLELKNMTPHLNQKLEVRVTDQSNGLEVGRKSLDAIYDKELTLIIPGIQLNTNYNVDFYADLNGNGFYDAPPIDHAWRETYNAGDDGDNDISFSHNTTFTDIAWKYLFTLDLTGMTPHIGQLFELRLVNTTSNTESGRISLDAVPTANFSVPVAGLIPGNNYDTDFYADLNRNGSYNSPPTDHAWRESFTAGTSNQVIDFAHNTNFVDINFPTAIGDEISIVAGEFKLFNNYPNPFNPTTTIRFNVPHASFVKLTIFNMLGQKVYTLVQNQLNAGDYQFVWNGTNESGSNVGSGIYFYRLEADSYQEVKQMMLVK